MTQVNLMKAIISLGGEEQVLRIVGNTYEGIEWIEEPLFTKEQVEEEVQRLQDNLNNTEYKKLRAAEYPDFREYLDGVVKGDYEQIQAYMQACLAVKAKYPKPQVND
jgi:hypothetical protein